ncbi:folylpolyglutamate synthase/dihydrofolate synthase family protein [Planomicrobium sp. YIM 101495]|uniref:bifunctional folylpolyglutamate synthase/dihydrofolate synthase n=1 Tax=Planomicrobium sp. YIM 101495 TaxID=2665160 RepID=UPI0012B6AE68|nr:Mur ligase family protein [Planomicrobium sp. YIM 101495]MTD29660.1 bifunctional folylpolyglutamate synthase/dihydrofolate synthase [Planomicrobium sp. YIM 101495]
MIKGLEQYKERWNLMSESAVKPGLNAIEEAMKELEDPHLATKTVHIAGTNGKGSTAAMLANILKKHGKFVGTFYSPGIHDLHDQIQIDGNNITEQSMDEIMQQLAKINTKLTDFELLTAAAFLAFRNHRVDFAIIEAGMGGRFDSTNVIRPEVSIIPSVAIEHADFLGSTLKEIAWHKGGIIKKWQPVIIGALPEEAENVIRDIANTLHSDLIQPRKLEATSLSLKGEHQRQNAALAIAAAEEVLKLEYHPVTAHIALVETVLPFRFEERYPGLILDGAHNEASTDALVQTVKTEYSDENFRVVVGILKDKDYGTVLQKLESIADEAVFVDFDNERALDARVLFEKCNISSKTLISQYDILPLTKNKKKTIVTGSLYLLSSLTDEKSEFLQNYQLNA